MEQGSSLFQGRIQLEDDALLSLENQNPTKMKSASREKLFQLSHFAIHSERCRLCINMIAQNHYGNCKLLGVEHDKVTFLFHI